MMNEKLLLLISFFLFNSLIAVAQTDSVQISFFSGSNIDYLIEGCTEENIITIAAVNDLGGILSADITITGAATLGTDYTLSIPSSLSFSPDQLSYSYPIDPISDALPEGTEQITITLSGDVDVSFSLDINDEIDLKLTPAQGRDLCLGDEVSLTVSGATTYQWKPTECFDSPVSSSTIITGKESGWVFVTGNVGTCSKTDSLFFQVDSLPDTTLNIIPVKDPYCLGDPIVYFSPQYDTSLYPDIMHIWSPEDLFDTLDTWNNSTTAQYDATIFRQSINNACTLIVEHEFRVIDTIIPVIPMDTIVCPGDQVQLQITEEGWEELQWTPTDMLSCTSCYSPRITVFESIGVGVTGIKEGCTGTGGGNINIIPYPMVIIQEPEGDICPGASVSLNAYPSEGVSNFSWKSGNQNIGGDEPSVVVTVNKAVDIGLDAIDPNGCPTSASLPVAPVDAVLQAPNIFSPSAQYEENKIFKPKVSSIVTETELLIFNRWGHKVFEGDLDTGWNGTIDGEQAPLDTYVYIITYMCGDRKSKLKGDITLIR